MPSIFSSVQFSSATQSCPTLCDPMNHSTPGLPVHHQLPEFTQTHVYWVHDAIQPSHLAWRIPGTEEPGGLPSMWSHRVGHDWSDLAAAAAHIYPLFFRFLSHKKNNGHCFLKWFLPLGLWNTGTHSPGFSSSLHSGLPPQSPFALSYSLGNLSHVNTSTSVYSQLFLNQ